MPSPRKNSLTAQTSEESKAGASDFAAKSTAATAKGQQAESGPAAGQSAAAQPEQMTKKQLKKLK